MSLWDIIGGISTKETLKDPESTWKKVNSATLSLINGDTLGYTNEGGSTKNVFGANVSFVCDMEVFLESFLGSWQLLNNGLGHFVLGTIFGPGTDSSILIGNKNAFNYMPSHAKNFTAFRGDEIKHMYTARWNDNDTGISWGARHRHKLMWLAIGLFSLSIAAFDITLNIKKNKIDFKTKQKANDKKYLDQQKEIAKEEAESEGQVVNPGAGGVDSHADEGAMANEDVAKAKEQYETSEKSLKKTETEYEWLIYNNIILESRGISVLRWLEGICAAANTVVSETKRLESSVAKIDASSKNSQANLQEEIANLEKVLTEIANTMSVTGITQAQMDTLTSLRDKAETLRTSLRNKLQNTGANVGVNNPAQAAAPGCWVARAVYGAENPKWILFRNWMFGPDAEPVVRTRLQKWYMREGQDFAKKVDSLPLLKWGLRMVMDAILLLNRPKIGRPG
jgi:hypothetical protein